MHKNIFIIFFLPFLLAAQVMALEANRLNELNAEYQKGARKSYGEFVYELQQKLINAPNLKEGARLATLIRGYIHGQIIAFDKSKKLDDAERIAVLQAHATTTAFFTLSPLGTDRYREDTLRYVMKDVNGSFAQELTIVADAVQAALWARQAGNQEHVTKEVFLRWMTPAYQRGGEMDVSQALGNWDYTNHKEAQKFVKSTIESILDFRFGILTNPLWEKYQSTPLNHNQTMLIGEIVPSGQVIHQPGDGQCGFYSVSDPLFRMADNYSGDTQLSMKFINSFDRAYYDPELFWMLVAYADASNPLNEEWKDPKYRCLRFEKDIQNHPRLQELLIQQRIKKNEMTLSEIRILNKAFQQIKPEEINQIVLISKNLQELVEIMEPQEAEVMLIEEAKRLKEEQEKIVSIIKLNKGSDNYFNWLNKEGGREAIANTQEAKSHDDACETLNTMRDSIMRDVIMTDYERLQKIPYDIRRQVIEKAKTCAAYAMFSNAANSSGNTDIPQHVKSLKDVKIENTNNQLEIKPGDDAFSPSVKGLTLETLASYINNQSIGVLVTNRVNAGDQMDISKKPKVGDYFLGKKVNRILAKKPTASSDFGTIYTVNPGSAGGGHFEVYATSDTPEVQLANALRNPRRTNDSFDLRASAAWHSKNNVPHGNDNMLQRWTAAYDWTREK